MATAFSHGIVGAALLPLAPRTFPRIWVLAALVALPMVPDLDVVAFKIGIPYSHPLGHRGFTHSLLYAVLQGYACAWIAQQYFRVPGRDWIRLGAVLSLATATHGLIDAMTDGGLGIAFFLASRQ